MFPTARIFKALPLAPRQLEQMLKYCCVVELFYWGTYCGPLFY